MNGTADQRVLERAEEQFGVVTRAQALSAGLSEDQTDYRLAQGRFEILFPSTYRVAGSPNTGRQRAMAALLWLGSNAAVSHLTAATLLRLDGCRTQQLHVTVPRRERRRAATDLLTVHRATTLPWWDCVTVDGLRCTSASRTLVDLAPSLDAEALEVAFESARRMGLTSARGLERSASQLLAASRRGAPAIRELLGHQREGDRALQYRLEVKTERLLRAGDLPRLERQVVVGPYRIDFALPPLLYGIECEGFDYHGSRLAWKRDKRRTSFLEAQGWQLTFVSWDDVTLRPQETLQRVSLALDRAAVPTNRAMSGEMAQHPA
jgi:very-short-patch-repair endonuclease